jgi:hypothetical protein
VLPNSLTALAAFEIKSRDVADAEAPLLDDFTSFAPSPTIGALEVLSENLVRIHRLRWG